MIGRMPGALIGLALLVAPAVGLAQRGTSMAPTETTPIVALMQRAAPALLRGDPDALQQLELDAADEPFRGIALLAPAQAPPSGALPVVILVQKSSMRGWEVTEEPNLLLAAFDGDTGALQIARALDTEPGGKTPAPNLRRPPRPPAAAEQTTMTNTYHVDARARLPTLPQSRALVLRALAFDWISDPVRVSLHARPAPVPPTIDPLPTTKPGQLPTYEVSKHHPPTPDLGVAARIERTRDGHPTLLGSFALAAAPERRLPAPLALPTAAGTQQAVAVVPVTLALVTLDSARTIIRRWVVPVFGASQVPAAQRLVGHFALDLRDLMPSGSAEDAAMQVAYVFMDQHVAGPLTLPGAPRR
ncbi:MAG: hypothetical protein ABI696_09350 [Rubrivivax sp.]